jgi:hypothetical protein
MGALLVVLFCVVVLVGAAYALGGEFAAEKEQRLVAEVLAIFEKEDATAKSFVGAFFTRIKLDYALAYDKVRTEIERAEAATKKFEGEITSKL